MNSKSFNRQEQCAHAWAHQQYNAGKASELYFEGATIFSYGSHFPIATIHADVVFFTERKYSNTTAKHKYLVRSAVSHKRIIDVHTVPVNIDPFTDKAFHHANIDHWVKEVIYLLRQFEQQPRKRSLLALVENIIAKINNFIQALRIAPPSALKRLMDSNELSAAMQYQHQRRRHDELLRKRQRQKAANDFIARLQRWEGAPDGQLPSVTIPAQLSNLAYLRVNTARNCIESSKGIRIPFAEAHACWTALQHVLSNGEHTCNIPVAGFAITLITPEKIVAGCHHIPLQQIEKIATQMQWTDAGAQR